MRKKIIISIISMVSIIVLTVLFINIFYKNTQAPSQTFLATILEINNNSVLVAPLEGQSELNCSDKISFGIVDLENIDAKVGDIVEITYDGTIMTSYPAQIRPHSWKLAPKTPSNQ